MMDSDDKIPDDFSCPICFEIPEREIFQCNNGHIICGTCCAKTVDCPQCRIPFSQGKVRNLVVESFLEKLKLDCPNKVRGCKERMRSKKLDQHLTRCKHFDMNKNVRFCKLLGVDCDFLFNTEDVASSIKHLTDKHNYPSAKGSSFKMGIIDPYLKLICTGKFALMPLIIKPNGDDQNPVFILITIVNPEDDSFSIVFLNASSDAIKYKQKTSYRVEISIANNSSEKLPNYEWVVPCFSILQSVVAFKLHQIRIPMSTLQNFFIEGSYIVVNAAITGGNIRKVENPRNWASPSVMLKSIRSTNVVIFNTNCDGCLEKGIREVNYICLQCADYDLCGSCMFKLHREHIFAKTVTLAQILLIRKSQMQLVGGKSTTMPMLPDTATAKGGAPGVNPIIRYECDRNLPGEITCRRKITYICLQCPNYSLCSFCMELEENNILSPHASGDHIFSVVLTENQSSMVKAHLHDKYAATGKGLF